MTTERNINDALLEAIAWKDAEIERMRSVLQELLTWNRLRSDFDAYLYALAEWGLGKLTDENDNPISERPTPNEFGLED